MAIKATVEEKPVRFTFRHIVEQREFTNGKVIVRPVTYCYLKTWDERQWIGEAITHPNDAFTKERGRKIALARALKESGLNWFQRKAVWEAYFGRGTAASKE